MVDAPSPWWFDYMTAEIVRSSDGSRWRVEHVPAFTCEEIDAFVASAPSNPGKGDR